MRKWLLLIGVGALILMAVGVVAGGLLFGDPHVAKGKKLFTYYCSGCHGEKGKGDGWNAKNLRPRPRDLTDSEEEYFASLTNEDIFGVLHRDMKEEVEAEEEEEEDEEALEEHHVPATMPTYKNTLSEEELWSIVAYVRTLHKNEAPRIAFTDEMKKERPRFSTIQEPNLSAISADESLAEEGRRLADEVYGCFGCHKVGEEGGEVGPALDRAGFRAKPGWLYRWIKNPQAMKRGTKMPTLGITDEHAIAIVAYLTTLRKGSELTTAFSP